MDATFLERATVWVTPVFSGLLLGCLLYKGRWRHFPAFTLLTACGVIFSVVLPLADFSARTGLYTGLYYTDDALSVGLQLAAVFELMGSVFRPTGTWVTEARRFFTIACMLGASAAVGASLLFSPPAIHGSRLVQLQVDTFTGLLTCEAVIAMMLAANHTGLAWRSHVMAIGQGLMFWALLTVSTEDAGAYLDPQSRSTGIFYMRTAIYLVTLLYWTVQLWHEEPVRKPISPAMRKYIVALHDQVQYDLGKAGH